MFRLWRVELNLNIAYPRDGVVCVIFAQVCYVVSMQVRRFRHSRADENPRRCICVMKQPAVCTMASKVKGRPRTDVTNT